MKRKESGFSTPTRPLLTNNHLDEIASALRNNSFYRFILAMSRFPINDVTGILEPRLIAFLGGDSSQAEINILMNRFWDFIARIDEGAETDTEGAGRCFGGSINPEVMKSLLKQSYEKKLKDYGDFKVDKTLSGTRTQVYFNASTGQAIVVHRGSQGIKDWVVNDAGLLVGYRGDRFKHAKDIQKKAEKKYGKGNVTTIGHSLGSKVAEEVGKDSKEIITLNKPTTPIDLVTGKKTPANQFDIRTTNDVVSILRPYQRESNNEITIPSSSYNVLKEHSPDVLSKLDRDIGIGGGAGASVPFNKEVQKKIKKEAEKRKAEYRRELSQGLPDTIEENRRFIPLEEREKSGGGAGASASRPYLTIPEMIERIRTLTEQNNLIVQHFSQRNLDLSSFRNQELLAIFNEANIEINQLEEELDRRLNETDDDMTDDDMDGGERDIGKPPFLIKDSVVELERRNEIRRQAHDALNNRITQLETNYYDIEWGQTDDDFAESFFTQTILDDLNNRVRAVATQNGFTDLIERINTIIQEITDDWNYNLIEDKEGDQPVDMEGGKIQTIQEIQEDISNDVNELLNEYHEINWTEVLMDTNERQYRQTERILYDLKELKKTAERVHLNALSNIIQQMIESIIKDVEDELISDDDSQGSGQMGGMRDGLSNSSFAGSPEFRDFCCLY